MMSGAVPAVPLGVTVVHFGSGAVTRSCLESLVSDPSSVERRVVVVDNGGNLRDDDLPPGCRLLSPGANLGFGSGANAGIEVLAAEPCAAFVVLNNDVDVLPGFLDAAARALGEPGVGAVAGPLWLRGPDGPLWYAGGTVSFLTGTVRQARRRIDATRRREVGFVPGAAVALRTSAWEDSGGFDPAFFLYNEDLDLCLRLRRAGWRLSFEPTMQAVHHLGASTGSAWLSPLYLEHITKTRLRPFRPLAYRLYLALLHSGYVATRGAALSLRRGRAAPASVAALLRGHMAALATIREGPRR